VYVSLIGIKASIK